MNEIDLLKQKLHRAIWALESIAGNPPTLMHNQDHHEVLAYSPGRNPAKTARECLEAIEALTVLAHKTETCKHG